MPLFNRAAALLSTPSRWLPAALCVGALLVATQARSEEAAAATAEGTPAPAPEVVRLAVYLMNLGKLDTSAGTYQMDFYVIARCDKPCQAIDFEIMNGKVTVEKQDDTPTFRVYRVRGELATNLDLRPYPFDHHTLEISIEDRLRDQSKLVFLPDLEHTSTHRRVIMAGWKLDPEWEVEVAPEYYQAFEQTYSRAVFRTHISRPIVGAFLKGLLPALFIVLSGFLALLMAPDKAAQRLTVSTSALVGSVLFHINLTSSVPPVGYLTFADRFMIINYGCLLGVLLANVLLMLDLDAGRTEKALRLHRVSRVLAPVVFAVLQVWNGLDVALH